MRCTALIVGALTAGVVPLDAAPADEIQAARTDGYGWFETCSFFGMWCTVHATAAPELVNEGIKTVRPCMILLNLKINWEMSV